MLIVRSKRVVTPEGVRSAAIHIDLKGVIRAVEPDESPDLSDSVVMPGLVDIHVHFNEPGNADWEGFESGTRAAAAGGFTTVIDMPVPGAPMNTLEAWSAKQALAEGKLWVDCGFWAGTTPGGDERETDLLWRAGVLGFLGPGQRGDDELRQLMRQAQALNAPLLFDVGSALSIGNSNATPGAIDSYTAYLASHPPELEAAEAARIAQLSQETGARTHILAVSSQESVEALAELRRERAPFSISTNPHHLFFDADQVPDGATAFLASPPIREKRHQDALWKALLDGGIDLIASGHSPAPRERKQGGFHDAWPGISGLQVALAAVWSARRPPIESIARWMSEEPARLAGLSHRKGRIAPGYDADLLVWNPQKKWMLMPQDLHHRNKMTAYVGSQLQGEVEAVFLRGAQIYAAGEFDDAPIGRVLNRS